MLEDFFGGDSLRAGDDLGVGEQIQGLADVDDLDRELSVGGVEEGVQLLDVDGVGFEEHTFAPAAVPLGDSQASGEDRNCGYRDRQAHGGSVRFIALEDGRDVVDSFLWGEKG